MQSKDLGGGGECSKTLVVACTILVNDPSQGESTTDCVAIGAQIATG